MKSKPNIALIEKNIYELLRRTGDMSVIGNAELQSLFDHYLPKARNAVRQYGIDDSLVFDFLQESFITLFSKITLGSFVLDAQRGFGAFLSVTVKNHLHTAGKQKKRWFSLSTLFGEAKAEPDEAWDETGNDTAGEIPFHEELPDHSAASEDLAEMLLQVMKDTLPETGIKLLILAFFHKKSNEEIARLMGYNSEATARKKKSQYLAMLRERIPPIYKEKFMQALIRS